MNTRRYKSILDEQKRKEFAKHELLRRCHQSISKNQFLKIRYRVASSYYLRVNKHYTSRLRNYCIITGRSGGIVRQYKMSRMCFKKYADAGLLAGVYKGSW